MPTPAIVFGHATNPARFAHFWQGAESPAPATQNHIWTFKSGPSMSCFLRAATACTFSACQLLKMLRAWCALYILTSKCASRRRGVPFSISHLARWLRTRRFSEPTFRPSGATNPWKTQWVETFLPFRAPASSFLWLFVFSDLLSSSLLFSDSSHLCFSICPYIVRSLTSKLPSVIILYIATVCRTHNNLKEGIWLCAATCMLPLDHAKNQNQRTLWYVEEQNHAWNTDQRRAACKNQSIE